MNSVWIVFVDTEYNYLNDLSNTVYAFASKKDAEIYRQHLIDCCVYDLTEWFECSEEEVYNNILDIQESQIFNTIYIEVEDNISAYFEIKEIPIMKFEEA